MSPPPPPWTCRLRALVVPSLLRSPALRVGGFVVVDYTDTPVGPYREAFTAVALSARSGWVPWMVVDSEASRAGGREGWGLPKELAVIDTELDTEPNPALSTARVLAEGVDLSVTARVAGGRGLPVRLSAQLRQPRRSAAQVRFTGRARPVVVVLDGTPPQGVRPGRRPGVALDGELRIGPPGS
ncbi:acetoacetate decarboxylase family protein [Quadrisphaera granulorum]|uniref:acetoacetate decarboxylase family protein n=1 Tax=Quadrisphaera granulorum TaxID=317664 RepID=UPI001B85F5EC|nr:acetoacetate decarboxylase family protein [Quadrisphaera granulorum]